MSGDPGPVVPWDTCKLELRASTLSGAQGPTQAFLSGTWPLALKAFEFITPLSTVGFDMGASGTWDWGGEKSRAFGKTHLLHYILLYGLDVL